MPAPVRVVFIYFGILVGCDLALQLAFVVTGQPLVNPLWPPLVMMLGAVIGPFSVLGDGASASWIAAVVAGFGLGVLAALVGFRYRARRWGHGLTALGLAIWSFSGALALGASY